MTPEAGPSLGPVEVEAETLRGYVHRALDGLLAVVDRVGDARLNQRPHGPSTNSVAVLVVHCCGVVDHWLGRVALGRPGERDRPAELRATATADELHALVAATRAQADADLAALDGTPAGTAPPRYQEGDLPGPGTVADVVLHVVEELYQHLGHAELTADALAA